MPEAAKLADLKSGLRGSVIERSDPAYDEVRALYNGMIDKRPLAIARCVDAADVITAVNFGRDNGIPIAIRGGGHNGPGLGSIDNGLVLDLSQMKGVRVDPTARTARVGAGCTQGDVDHATHAFGLAVPAGIISTTGIAGLTLSGGHGYLSRKYGLTIDNLIEADVVLADGSFAVANRDENADLFWALRGGGGNFGVVTSFEYALHRVGPTVAGGAIFYGGDDAEAVLRGWREWLPGAPDELTTVVNLTTAPPAPFIPEAWHGKRVAAIVGLHAGSVEAGLEALAPLRKLADPVADLFGPIPYVGMQSLIDALHPPGDGNYFKAAPMTAMPDEAIEALLESHRAVTSPQNEIHVHDLRGAVARPPAGGSPVPFRDAPYVVNVIGKWPGGGPGPDHVDWARDLVNALEPFGTGVAYVNFLSDGEDTERLRTAYGAETYDRLVAAKDRWDPENVFHLNQNVRPS
jgi:FAD/FMN-containing dehydrogenase